MIERRDIFPDYPDIQLQSYGELESSVALRLETTTALEHMQVISGAAYILIKAGSNTTVGFDSYCRSVCDAGIVVTGKENGDMHIGFFHFIPGERNITTSVIAQLQQLHGKGVKKAVLACTYDEEDRYSQDDFKKLRESLRDFSDSHDPDIITIDPQKYDAPVMTNESLAYGQLLFGYSSQTHTFHIDIPGANYRKTFKNPAELRLIQQTSIRKKIRES